MGGIAGWLERYTDISENGAVIDKMLDTLKRRGPEQGGVHKDCGAVLFSHRLPVIDAEGGTQPMIKAVGEREYIVVYNGEIYNVPELKDDLIQLGHSFKTRSDTEVLLTAYIEWGDQCVNKLNGVFAFAVYEKRSKKLFLARDRIGVKPLFYFVYDGGIVFSSEIKTLLCNPRLPHHVDETGLMELLFMSPGRSPGLGVIKNVEELLPGECAVYDGNYLQKHRYFKLTANEHTDSLDDTLEKTRFLIKDSVERQLVSDVPICSFLSGGLDSSIISKLASDYLSSHGRGKLTTFSIDYEDNAKYFKQSEFQPNTDKEFIEVMAKQLNSNHKDYIIKTAELAKALTEAQKARDLPGMADVDSSFLLACREVSKSFSVALSGECADELFGGYPWYHKNEMLFEQCFPWARSLHVRRSIIKEGIIPSAESYIQQKYFDTVRKTDKLPGDSTLESRMREMFCLNFNWFMQTLLDRNDRMSMYSGLEARVPFCDYRIVQYAYNMPWSIKALDGREKGVLRKAMEGILPEKIIKRKKSPYPKTHNPEYFRIVSEMALSCISDKTSVISRILSEDGIKNIIADPDSITSPWYGQLMKAPQILAYIVQLDSFFREYNIQLV